MIPMPEYTKSDLPLIQEAIKSAQRRMDQAESETKLWAVTWKDAHDRHQFWTGIMAAVKKMEDKR